MRPVRMTLVALLLSVVSAYGQSFLTLEDLMNMPGKNIGKGSNTNPVGPFGVKSYHLEELTLTAPVIVDGQTINVSKAWRISITGGPFPVRASAATISVGGVDLRTAIENSDLSEIGAITFDDSMLLNGATITLSYADDGTDVPDKLNKNI